VLHDDFDLQRLSMPPAVTSQALASGMFIGTPNQRKYKYRREGTVTYTYQNLHKNA
jgi:hypothetical protein